MPDSLKVGEMRFYLVALRGTEVKGDRGQKTITWVPAFNFYASKASLELNEQFSSVLTVPSETVIFSTWFRSDLTNAMRIQEGADIWHVIGITPNQVSMQIKCRRIENE